MERRFEIRFVTIDEVDRIAPLFDLYRSFYNQPSDVSAAGRFLRDRLLQGESVVFGAFLLGDEQFVGFTQLYPSFSSVSICKIMILNDLFVVPSMRKKGVATAMLRQAAAYARETGAKSLSLSTAIDNHTAQKLYESEGYMRDEQYFYYSLRL